MHQPSTPTQAQNPISAAAGPQALWSSILLAGDAKSTATVGLNLSLPSFHSEVSIK
jgi:hypothetical protein